MTQAVGVRERAAKAAVPGEGVREEARPGVWRRWHLGALLAHLGLSVYFTWPLALNFLPGAGTQVPGVMIEDRDQNLWNLWWVRDALSRGHNPFIADKIWYPTPVSLYYHTLNIFNGLLAAPLLSVFSLTTVYNVIVLFSFVMGGYGAFLLVRYLCGNRWAALIGSVVFVYSAYHVATMRSLLQLISLEWVPFYVLFLLQAVYQPHWHGRDDVARWLLRRALPAALFLFLVALVDWYYTMYALLLTGFLAIYILARHLWQRARHAGHSSWWTGVGERWARIVVCLGVFLLLVAPILVPTIQELRATHYMQPAADSALSNSADLLAFFQPVRGQQIWGRFFTNRREWPFGSNRYEVYLTYTALFLAAVGLFATKAARPRLAEKSREEEPDALKSRSLPGKWFWATCVVVFFLLALGPVLQINGQQIKWLFSPNIRLFMPYNLVEHIPVLNISRSPDRFDMPLTLCLGVLAGYGTNVLMSAWWPRLRFNTRGALLSLGAVALIVVELTPAPYPQRPADIPAWYYQLGKEPGDFSILELPPQDDYWHGAFRMYFQTAHGKPIFGGYISREFPHPFLQSTPGYQELIYIDGAGDMFADGPDQWYSAFAQYKTRYIVLQKERLPGADNSPPEVAKSRDALKHILGEAAQPVHSDSQLEVYQVPLPPQQVPYLSVGDGWEPREKGPNGTFRWMGTTATLRVDSPRSEAVTLRFRAAGLGEPQPLQIFQGKSKVFDGQVGALQEFSVGPLSLPAGASTLTFISPSGTTSPAQLGMGDDPRQLSFAILDARLEPAR